MFTPSDVSYAKAIIEVRQYLDGLVYELPETRGTVRDILAGLQELETAVEGIRENYRQYGFDDGMSDAKRIFEGEYGKGFEDGRLEGYKEGYEIGLIVGGEKNGIQS